SDEELEGPMKDQPLSADASPNNKNARNCKKVGHMTWECRNPTAAKNQRTHTCYECGSLRHFKSKCPIVKFQKCVNKKISTLSERRAENKKRRGNRSRN
ncbi:reverse transcriptase domain-containing protein, partial [Tanacetum coccineum]